MRAVLSLSVAPLRLHSFCTGCVLPSSRVDTGKISVAPAGGQMSVSNRLAPEPGQVWQMRPTDRRWGGSAPDDRPASRRCVGSRWATGSIAPARASRGWPRPDQLSGLRMARSHCRSATFPHISNSAVASTATTSSSRTNQATSCRGSRSSSEACADRPVMPRIELFGGWSSCTTCAMPSSKNDGPNRWSGLRSTSFRCGWSALPESRCSSVR